MAAGSRAWLRERGFDGAQGASGDDSGRAEVFVGADGRFAGVIFMGDHLRDEARNLADRLRALRA